MYEQEGNRRIELALHTVNANPQGLLAIATLMPAAGKRLSLKFTQKRQKQKWCQK